jgi:signal transduction histidine kinase
MAERMRERAAGWLRARCNDICVAACVILWLASLAPSVCVAEALPRRVLIVDQLGPAGPFNNIIAGSIRSTLSHGGGTPISVFTEYLDIARFSGPQHDERMRIALQEKYREKPIGAIVVLGFEGLRAVMHWHPTLWPGVPVVFALVNEDAIAHLALPSGFTGRTVRLTLSDAVIAARAMVPSLKRMALIGDPWAPFSSRSNMERELTAFGTELEFIDLRGLPMSEVKSRATALPPDTAILYTQILVDGAGVSYTPREALAEIAAVANRPIVIQVETQLGFGGTGGFLADPRIIGAEAGALALRIINGERTSTMPVAASDSIKPIFDWRELQRWTVSEDRLPPGSQIRFRELSVWEQYRTQVVTVGIAMLLQTGLIAVLLYEDWRRRAAEAQARSSLSQLAHMDRVTMAGQLSASIAHEINQPLAAIVAYASAGSRWLAGTAPNLDEAREAFKKIAGAGHHAAEVIERIRSIFKKGDPRTALLDVNDLIREVLALVGGELKRKRVSVEIFLADRLPPVVGDAVQLRQVMLNLVLNAAEAMESVADRARILRVVSALGQTRNVIVQVEDSGPGIDPRDIEQVFKPFFTTKSNGMGMGLSISRSIVEAHHGRLWASCLAPCGSVFHLVLPSAGPQPQEARLSPKAAAAETAPVAAG